jgi:large subunit ribosomal protein L25
MKSIAISGSPRENVGKRDAKELRYEGKVPAVLYGGKNQIHFSVSASDLKSLVYTPEVSFVALDVAGVKAQAIIQDVHFHPLTDMPLHVDFLELDEKQHLELKEYALAVGITYFCTPVKKFFLRFLKSVM